jgi:hypothetical protein
MAWVLETFEAWNRGTQASTLKTTICWTVGALYLARKRT